MSEMSRKARADGRAKIKRLMVDPKGKIDASGWEPPEALMAGRKVYDKAKERSATTKIYKHGGRIQGDRGPRRRDKITRGHKADGGVPATRFNEGPIEHSNFMNRGGKTGCEHMAKGGKTRTGNHGGDGYYEGTRPIGGRIARAKGGKAESYWTYQPSEETPSLDEALKHKAIHPDTTEQDWGKMSPGMRREIVRSAKKTTPVARAHGGRAKGKTNIVINIGEKGGQQPMPPMPPIQAPTRPPMMPPGPPPGMAGPPGGPGGPPMPPPSMAGGPPPGMMPRKRGGRTMKPKQGVDVHMSAGAGGGLGRLEKARRYGAHQS